MRGVTGSRGVAGIVQKHIGPGIDRRDGRPQLKITGMGDWIA
jgi:hypothetical protein